MNDYPMSDYFAQFETVQPIMLICTKCNEDSVIMKGYNGEGLRLPICCPYCGHLIHEQSDHDKEARH